MSPEAPRDLLVPVARALFSAIFLVAAPSHLRPEVIALASAHGVPFADVMVPFAGALVGLGGLSVALGLWTRVGAWLLILFLVPVTVMIHDFWAIAEPAARAAQRVDFLRNLALLGGAILLAYHGGGPFSLDRRFHQGRTPPL